MSSIENPKPTGDPRQPPTSTGKRRWLWRFGIGCGVLLLLGIIAACVFILPFIRGVGDALSEADEREKAYWNPPPGMNLIIKESERVPKDLKPFFIEFYFHGPEKFQVVPDDTSFVRYEEIVNGSVLESFAVSPIPFALPAKDGWTAFPGIMKEISRRFANGYGNYREISQESENIPYHDNCWGMRWQAEEMDASGQLVPIYGRVLLVGQSRAKKGVVITMIAKQDPAVHSAEEVAVKGDLASILPTFRLERPVSSTRNPGRRR